MLNFYTNPLSPFATRVHLFLEESGQPYKVHITDLAKGQQRTPEFVSMNPMSAVPTIELNGHGMGESNAILRYLAQRWQLSSWYPENLEDRARVDQLTEFTNIHVTRWLNDLAWNLEVAPKFFGGKPNLEKAEEHRGMLLRNLNKLETYMHGRTYLAAEVPTIADISLAPFAIHHQMAHVSFSDFPNVAAWTARMAARPSWKKVMTEREKMLPSK
jgi:glutathione S-transferase